MFKLTVLDNHVQFSIYDCDSARDFPEGRKEVGRKCIRSRVDERSNIDEMGALRQNGSDGVWCCLFQCFNVN